jgi:hypothetical protein
MSLTNTPLICDTLPCITGNVKFVTVDIAKHPYKTQEKKLVLPAVKKFLQAYIPRGKTQLPPTTTSYTTIKLMIEKPKPKPETWVRFPAASRFFSTFPFQPVLSI